jgi:hypothetical protein
VKKTSQSTSTCRLLAALAATVLLALPLVANAGEGGTTHIIPGAMATLADNAPGMMWVVPPSRTMRRRADPECS